MYPEDMMYTQEQLTDVLHQKQNLFISCISSFDTNYTKQTLQWMINFYNHFCVDFNRRVKLQSIDLGGRWIEHTLYPSIMFDHEVTNEVQDTRALIYKLKSFYFQWKETIIDIINWENELKTKIRKLPNSWNGLKDSFIEFKKDLLYMICYIERNNDKDLQYISDISRLIKINLKSIDLVEYHSVLQAHNHILLEKINCYLIAIKFIKWMYNKYFSLVSYEKDAHEILYYLYWIHDTLFQYQRSYILHIDHIRSQKYMDSMMINSIINPKPFMIHSNVLHRDLDILKQKIINAELN